ncbi:hypothetical protein [Echinicola salinicaeni]|uniref:hypothetical protein n=1 Tax=Echinicola salinicaeni TaxID=2762757 RepID=UPI001646DFE1|nr:hypothetical protein [Echinicola salinicaeni]
MKRLQQLTKEINDITLKIEQEYPELYQYLDENPITISSEINSKMDTKNFSDYLNSLKQLLKHHMEEHPQKK